VSASKPIAELRTVAAGLILGRLEKMTVTQAAAELGVSRQAIYGIKRGDFCPSLALIQRACEAWKLDFTFRNLRVAKGTLATKRSTPASAATQLDLFEVLAQLKNHHARIVQTKRMGTAVELTFRLQLEA
jgi:DNA-binding XRE family transcriptional regulator